MIDQPLVCICIPTYNAAGTVRETLVSILSQTYENLVVHISDNASTDDTLKIIESLADQRVHIHRHSENIGGEGNFNRCMQLAEGKFTALFHADDLYEPEMVGKQVAFLEAHSEAGAAFTEARTIDEAGRVFGEINFPAGLGSFDMLYDFETIFKAVLRHSNFFICPSAMVRTEVYRQEIKFWRGDLFKSSADLDVWLRLAQSHKIGLIPEPLMRYRISANQFSARVRLQTARPDFFLVIEYYLAKKEVRKLLDKEDMENYASLDRRDRVMRAVNCILSGNADGAQNLLRDVYSWKALISGLKTKRGLGVLVAGIYLKMLLLFGLEKFGQLTLGYLKQFMRK